MITALSLFPHNHFVLIILISLYYYFIYFSMARSLHYSLTQSKHRIRLFSPRRQFSKRYFPLFWICFSILDDFVTNLSFLISWTIKVNQASGRVYILKFHTDDRKLFFWMQVWTTNNVFLCTLDNSICFRFWPFLAWVGSRSPKVTMIHNFVTPSTSTSINQWVFEICLVLWMPIYYFNELWSLYFLVNLYSKCISVV